MSSRRDFLKMSLLAGAATALYGTGGSLRAYAASGSPPLRKFIQPLPEFGKDIPLASPTSNAGVDYYEIALGQYTQRLHPDLPNETTLWGYADRTGAHRHLGGGIVAKSGTPVQATFYNNLPGTHPLPIDRTLPGADGAVNRAAVHLHGGHVPWTGDGGPFAWFDPVGNYGPSCLNQGPSAGTTTHFYPNDQSARLMFYHDHAVGITRLNVYAGVAAPYIVLDSFEANLIDAGTIPPFERQVPLVIQDKTFAPDGSLWYPSEYELSDWPGAPYEVPPVPSCVPEFFGDTMLVNGVVYPFKEVEARRYRLRLLNACNSRFCRLQLFYAQSATSPGDTEPALNRPGPAFVQIGNEAGFLPSETGPVALQQIILAPAERADVIVDFSTVPEGAYLILYNDAPAPFPMGDAGNDYYPGNKKNPVTSMPGYGPDTRTLMQFRVKAATSRDPRQTSPLKLPSIAPLAGATVVRNITLNEDFDGFGRLIQRTGTDVQQNGNLARNYMDDATEVVQAGATEIWRIFNLTGDTHPIHFHLVNVQLMGRQKFQYKIANGQLVPKLVGLLRPPDPNETGWKETIRMDPGEMTQVIMKFDLAPSTGVPSSPRFASDPKYVGRTVHEFVYHCHILEHEEHDMMRPLLVVS